MNERIKSIYAKLYENSISCTKEKLAEEFKITTKSIENTIKEYKEDIIYDKKLKRYRFVSLLPKYITYKVFYNIFKDSIADEFIKDDFLAINNSINNTNDLIMIETDKLSDIVKKIIKFTIAINDNCILKVEYSGNGKDTEFKYIQPNTILSNGFSYFCYITYDELNKKDVGQSRTFKFTNMKSIEQISYVNNTIFKQDKIGTVFGSFQQDKYITLVFNRISGDFFKSNNMFNNPKYEIVVGLGSDNVIVKMYYNNIYKEVVKTIQQWMPNIRIHDSDPLKDKIYEIIKSNYEDLFK